MFKILFFRRFLLNDEGGEDLIQDILANGLIYDGPDESKWIDFDLKSFLHHEGFVCAQICLVSAFVALALWRKVKVWRIAVVVFVGSVCWTWIHLYKLALARKQATLTKLGEVPQKCLVEKQGWFSALSDAIFGNFKDKKCEAYYEALMVDPFWEVTPLKALTETLSNFILRPLEMFGSSVGVFFSEILSSDVPLLWKAPILIIAAVIILLIVLMACRYKIKSPMLFSIEPCSSSPVDKAKNVLKKPDVVPQPVEDASRVEPLPYPPEDPPRLRMPSIDDANKIE